MPVTPKNFTAEGRALPEQASETDLATALFRNRVIHPEDYQDDEQAQTATRRAAIPARTRQYWQQLYRIGETRYGSGFLGLLPHYHNCGGLRQIDAEVITLIHQVLETHYDTTTRKPKRGAYGEYLKCSQEQHLNAVSQKRFTWKRNDILGNMIKQSYVKGCVLRTRSKTSFVNRSEPSVGMGATIGPWAIWTIRS
ncbi:MAG: hypothetical protein NVSMB27_34440 [Ktedonobacteraceae bacterium]